MAIPPEQEVKDGTLSNPTYAATGANGFSSGFYLSWPFIFADLYAAALEFLHAGSLSFAKTACFITLVPKIENPKEFTAFRPF